MRRAQAGTLSAMPVAEFVKLCKTQQLDRHGGGVSRIWTASLPVFSDPSPSAGELWLLWRVQSRNLKKCF